MNLLLAALEPRIAAYAETADPARLKRTIRRWILEADPAREAKRRKQAEHDRYVHVTAHDNGTALVDAVLPAAGGQTLYERLREMANTHCCTNDPRTSGQRRADALVALADGSGRLLCQCGRPACPHVDTPADEPRTPLIQVGVSAETLAGLQDNPALLAGFGAIDADLARQLARHARYQIFPEPEATSLNHAGTEPVRAKTGQPAKAADSRNGKAELRYRPGARLAALVRAVDGACRAPGCQTPAAATDLDHHIPFNHADPARGGRTAEANLSCRCRRHHRSKTLADNDANGWRVRQHPGRRHEWLTPTGESATTEPEGADYLFPRESVAPTAVVDIAAPDKYARSPIDGSSIESELRDWVHAHVPPGQRRQPLAAPEALMANSDRPPPF
ncbi:HNH endonuclease signature motif containing protein [Nocardia mexicana]|uniref:Uncharacterized protein DUF222 n=1 Tax=Nocardia mexicana TaxID=279262 RepID=A0A370H8P9_9NOCA|nr:HNH endonuclease signature motif containing protein [Nocardia mexicana]RDI50711.1 uncharacterized protein DUF222 [Nocardia mexicana]